jgi:ubiquinone biosynthesis protein Coq4
MDMSNEHWFVSTKILFVSVLTHLWCLVLGHYYLINIIENFDNNITKNAIQCDPILNKQIDNNSFYIKYAWGDAHDIKRCFCMLETIKY